MSQSTNLVSLHPDKLRVFDGVTFSAIGVGTYLGESSEAVDRQYEDALVTAAQNGVTIFDTAVNYRCQRSERNIAYALRKLAGLGIHREKIFIATKGGFLPAEGSAEGFQNYIFKSYLNTGIMTADDIVANCHCMTPKYLQSQVNLSLANLKVNTIDLYYVHNPETQFGSVSQNEFYERLTRAFATLEENVAAGKIKRYGVATWNGFRVPQNHASYLSLEKVLECAKTAGGEKHNFKAIQLPYNLAMLEAVALQNQSTPLGDLPIIAAAAHFGIGVFISAPLLQGKVFGIPQKIFDEFPVGAQRLVPEGHAAPLQFVTSSPGVIAAMVGMKSAVHVTENLKILHEPNWSVEDLQNAARLLVK